MRFLRVDERSSDSYIGLNYFFFRKSLEVCSGSKLLFRGLTLDFFSFPLLKGRQTPVSNSESVKVTKNVIDFFFRMIQFLVQIKNSLIFLKKKAYGHLFILSNSKVEIFSKKSILFFCLLAFIDSFRTICWLCFRVLDVNVVTKRATIWLNRVTDQGPGGAEMGGHTS